jgi:nucleoside-diphosphate-sugar epimerase
LTEAQATLVVAVRDPAAFSGIAARWRISADVRPFDALDAASIRRTIGDAQPGFVFNLIGYGVDRRETDPDVFERLNHDFVAQLALAVAHSVPTRSSSQGLRLVHVGSALEYGLFEGVAMENSDVQPHTLYGRTKLAGTVTLRDAARESGLNAVTARVFTVFGPGEQETRLLPTIRRAAADGTSVRLSAGTQRRDFCYVEDVAEGLLRLGLSMGAPGEVVNLATGRMTSVRDFAMAAARILGLPDDRLEFGAEPIRSDEMRISGVDVRRLVVRTGWIPSVGLDEGLRRAAAFEANLEHVGKAGR